MDVKKVLTDEMSLVEFTGDAYYVWGTPFWGELQMSVNDKSKLEAVFILSQAGENSIDKMSFMESVNEFLKIVLYFGQTIEASNELIDMSMRLVSNVPVKRLNFLPDISLWEVVDDWLGDKSKKEHSNSV